MSPLTGLAIGAGFLSLLACTGQATVQKEDLPAQPKSDDPLAGLKEPKGDATVFFQMGPQLSALSCWSSDRNQATYGKDCKPHVTDGALVEFRNQEVKTGHIKGAAKDCASRQDVLTWDVEPDYIDFVGLASAPPLVPMSGVGSEFGVSELPPGHRDAVVAIVEANGGKGIGKDVELMAGYRQDVDNDGKVDFLETWSVRSANADDPLAAPRWAGLLVAMNGNPPMLVQSGESGPMPTYSYDADHDGKMEIVVRTWLPNGEDVASLWAVGATTWTQLAVARGCRETP